MPDQSQQGRSASAKQASERLPDAFNLRQARLALMVGSALDAVALLIILSFAVKLTVEGKWGPVIFEVALFAFYGIPARFRWKHRRQRVQWAWALLREG